MAKIRNAPKRDRIIKMLSKGMRKAEIARTVGAHWTYVHAVSRKMKKGGEPLQSFLEAKIIPLPAPHNDAPANAVQVGGDHYKQHLIQPWDAIANWQLGFLDGNVVKYVSRWRSKGGVQDLKKARHYLDKLIELESAGVETK